MGETEETRDLWSIQILLPEAVERRLERWTEKMPGASWPASGGHITLLPHFVPKGTMEEIRATLEMVCTEERPFAVRVASPISVKDTTRPDYCAVFLTVEGQDGELHRPLHDLRNRLLTALEPLREDVRPELLEQPFLPHITLALGVAEAEAVRLVRALRAEPLEAGFRVEAIWLITQTRSNGARQDRYSIPLGGIARAEVFRD